MYDPQQNSFYNHPRTPCLITQFQKIKEGGICSLYSNTKILIISCHNIYKDMPNPHQDKETNKGQGLSDPLFSIIYFFPSFLLFPLETNFFSQVNVLQAYTPSKRRSTSNRSTIHEITQDNRIHPRIGKNNSKSWFILGLI